jgi:hypothetical protein
MRRPTMTLAVLTLLCACGEPFLNPPVTCPVRTFAFSQTGSPANGARVCSFGEYPFSIAYAPRVDTVRDPDAKEYALPRGRVTLTAGDTAVRLCPGSAQDACRDGVSELTTVISDTGVVSYQGVYTTDLIALGPGGMFKSSGALVFENFGPGNTCRIDATYEFSCQAPVK